jgi:hypothetical protein
MSGQDVPPAVRVQALQRLAAGEALLAVKVVVDAGLSLKDAKEYVDGLRWEVTARLVTPSVEARAAELVAGGQAAKAARLVRKATRAERRDAKAYVEALVAGRRPRTVADRARAFLEADDRPAALATVQAETGMTEDEAARFLSALGGH